MPKDRPLNEIEMRKYGSKLKHFRDVYCMNNLPQKPRRNEMAILNLDSCDGPGSHWTAWAKAGDYIEYFDSFGNLQPNKEVIDYLGENILYNFDKIQEYNSFICGQLSLKFLEKFSHKHFH